MANELPNEHDVAHVTQRRGYGGSVSCGEWAMVNNVHFSALRSIVSFLADAPPDMTVETLRAALIADGGEEEAEALAYYKSKD